MCFFAGGTRFQEQGFGASVYFGRPFFTGAYTTCASGYSVKFVPFDDKCHRSYIARRFPLHCLGLGLK